ncbi:MAG TPA: (deoxy)nucleoside triphosphate pyrophosphohydrolase [Opitutaceae bacterium]|nr:(deoxy)nucleoside triphosphate pyrophosphohydrolase [Opitutaceae bacterium]
MCCSPPLPVVCVLLERNECVLIAQRPPHKHLGLAWEFPGGKVEPGELLQQSLAREIQEELGCTLTILAELPTREHAYPALTIRMTPFVATLAPGSAEPSPNEHIALAWVRLEDLPQRALAPADVPILDDYRQWKASQSLAQS